MSPFWSWFITILTLVNIAAAVWLLLWTAQPGTGSSAGNEVTGHRWDEDLEEYNNPLPRWWLYLFLISVAWGLAYLVWYPGLGNFSGVAGWTQTGQYEAELAVADERFGEVYAAFAGRDMADLATDPAALQIGASLYSNHCEVCHGAGGQGAPGFPNLADDDWLWGGAPDQVYQSIAKGRAGTMPPLAAALGDDGVEEVTAFVQSLSGGTVDGALAERGRARFAMCAACHGPDGKGNQLLGAPNLTDDIWLYGGDAEAIRTGLVNGRNGQMPAHLGLLTEDQIRILAAYVLALSGGGSDKGGQGAL